MDNINNITNTEEKPYIDNTQELSGKINPIPAPVRELGMDIDGQFIDDFIYAGINSRVDTAQIQAFSTISQSRDTVYTLLDTMAQDPTIAAVLETYAEDATEPNDKG